MSCTLALVIGSQAQAAMTAIWTEDFEGDTSAWTLDAPSGTNVAITTNSHFPSGSNSLYFGADSSSQEVATASRPIGPWQESLQIVWDQVLPDFIATSTTSSFGGNGYDQHPTLFILDDGGNLIIGVMPDYWNRGLLWTSSDGWQRASTAWTPGEVNQWTLNYDAATGGVTLSTDTGASVSGTTSANASLTEIRFMGGNSGGDMWESPTGDAYVDNITVSTVGTEIPEPATMTLLGLGGLAILRRRRS